MAASSSDTRGFMALTGILCMLFGMMIGLFIGFVIAYRRHRKESSPPNNVLTRKDLYKDQPAPKSINLTNNHLSSPAKQFRGSSDSILNDSSYDPYNVTLEKAKKSYV